MILVRTTMQVKFGHMDAVLAVMKEAYETFPRDGGRSWVMTDASGQMFTLVTETEAESIDSYMDAMQAMLKDPEAAAFMGRTMEHIESGQREFFTIEFER